MAQYSIKDLEKVTGIKAHTIRIWEKRYAIVEPGRSDTNIRSYTDDDLKKLLNISMLNRNGFKISKLAKMSETQINKELLDISEKPEDSDTKIEALLMAMIDLNEVRFNEVLNRAIKHMGFEDAFVKVVRPALIKAGVLWMSGTISPAEEHFVSNLIRQKIIAEIDSLSITPKNKSKRFLLFLPEGEMHELGILFLSYLIRRNGHESLYFGQNTPLTSMEKAAREWKADYVILSIVNSMAIKTMEEFLETLTNSFPSQDIFISGYQTQFLDVSSISNLEIVDDYLSFGKMLREL